MTTIASCGAGPATARRRLWAGLNQVGAPGFRAVWAIKDCYPDERAYSLFRDQGVLSEDIPEPFALECGAARHAGACLAGRGPLSCGRPPPPSAPPRSAPTAAPARGAGSGVATGCPGPRPRPGARLGIGPAGAVCARGLVLVLAAGAAGADGLHLHGLGADPDLGHRGREAEDLGEPVLPRMLRAQGALAAPEHHTLLIPRHRFGPMTRQHHNRRGCATAGWTGTDT